MVGADERGTGSGRPRLSGCRRAPASQVLRRSLQGGVAPADATAWSSGSTATSSTCCAPVVCSAAGCGRSRIGPREPGLPRAELRHQPDAEPNGVRRTWKATGARPSDAGRSAAVEEQGADGDLPGRENEPAHGRVRHDDVVPLLGERIEVGAVGEVLVGLRVGEDDSCIDPAHGQVEAANEASDRSRPAGARAERGGEFHVILRCAWAWPRGVCPFRVCSCPGGGRAFRPPCSCLQDVVAAPRSGPRWFA